MATGLMIRLAVKGDRDALEALQWRASLNNSDDREALLANPDAILLPIEQIAAGQVFVAEWDSKIVGFAAVLIRTDGETELDGLFVEPDAWKRGIGRSLVDHCAAFAMMSGSASLHVVGNRHAEGFYLACNFKQTGVHETRFGEGLLLRKKL